MKCPVCNYTELKPLLRKDEMPLYNMERHHSKESAKNARVGMVNFEFCSNCGFAFNSKFDPDLMNYSVNYENSRTCSTVYNRYIDSLAHMITSRTSLLNRLVVEIGCGDGQFLRALRLQVEFDGVGFDPSLNVIRSHEADTNITFRREYFSKESLGGRSPDVVILRHVLEHQSNPAAFLEEILSDAPDIYIEVPAWEWIVKFDQFYAFSYEHCSYFSRESLALLLGKLGYTPGWIEYGFNGEYLQYYGSHRAGSDPIARGCETLTAATTVFIQRIEEQIKKVREQIDKLSSDCVLWGAAGKGITLLNLMDIYDSQLPFVVDSNPQKAGTFIPRTAQRVVMPAELQSIRPKYILITNPLYKEEIIAQLEGIGIQAEIVMV